MALHRQAGLSHAWICGTAFLIAGVAIAFFTGGIFTLFICLTPVLGLHLWQSHRENKVQFSPLAVLSLIVFWARISINNSQLGLATSWAMIGTVVLLIGLLCRSRPFRMTALGILVLALGHVMLIDVVKLDPLPRILSFLSLGFGLLGLGFVYNRFHERLKSML